MLNVTLPVHLCHDRILVQEGTGENGRDRDRPDQKANPETCPEVEILPVPEREFAFVTEAAGAKKTANLNDELRKIL